MLTLQPGDIFAEHYKLVRLVDTGGFAEVWEAIFLTAGNTVALKIYPRLDAEGVKNIEDEYINQAELSHTNLLIARYFGKLNGYPFLEMRYCAGGNASVKLGSYQEDEIARCIAHIGSALAYLHDNGIVHQDVKPNNFLLDSRGNYYLADLGLSLRVRSTIRKYTQTKDGKDSIYAGLTPPAYRGPELYDRTTNGGPIMASDIWAFGASLFEMITGDVPLGEFGGLMQLNQPEPPNLPDGFSAELNYIIKKCLSKETWDRPRASELHHWAQQYLEKGSYGVKMEEPVKQEHKKESPKDDPKKQDDPGKEDTGKQGGTIKDDPNRQRGTIRDNQLDQGNQHGQQDVPPRPGPDPRPKKWWVIIAVVVVLAGFGIKWVVDHNAVKASDNVLPPKDTTVIIPKDTVHKKIDSPHTKIDSPEKKIDSPEKKIHTDPPPPPASVIIDHPSIRVRPKSGYIDIVRIEKTTSRLNITFRVKKLSDKSTISIYGPEDPDHCFYVLAGGNKYRLQSVDKKGKSITITSDAYTFTASFQKIPESVRTITVMEGEDQDSPDQNYWNFFDVNVTKY